MQLQAYAACDHPDVREAVRAEFLRLVRFVQGASGAPDDAVQACLARGMLMNVGAAMDLEGVDADWARTAWTHPPVCECYSVNNTAREVGGVFGVAVLASVFSAVGLSTPLAFVDGMVAAVWVGAAIVGTGVFAALAIPGRRAVVQQSLAFAAIDSYEEAEVELAS